MYGLFDICHTLALKPNDHLYSLIHVVEQPDCACEHIRENNTHLLLDCLYHNERNQMITELNGLGFKPLL